MLYEHVGKMSIITALIGSLGNHAVEHSKYMSVLPLILEVTTNTPKMRVFLSMCSYVLCAILYQLSVLMIMVLEGPKNQK